MANNNNTNFNNIRFTTPKGYAQYPYLLEPDTKFNPDGDYKVNLALDDTDMTLGLLSKLNRVLDDFYESDEEVAKALAKGRKVQLADIYERDEEGRYVLKFKQKAKITKKDGTKFDVKLPQFDSKGKPISVNIGRDSVIKINFSVRPYFMPSTRTCGLSLRPVAVQVIELREFSNTGSADSYGFGEEEGGYTGSNETPFAEEDYDNEDNSNRGDF